MKQFGHNKQKPNGLTLVELVVAIGLFGILALIGVRIFTRMTEIQERSQELQNVEGDLRYAMDVLINESQDSIARTGADASCGNPLTCDTPDFFCVNPLNTELCLLDKNSVQVKYFLANGSLIVDRGGTQYAITSDDINLTEINFLLSPLSDRVVVQISASANGDYNKTINYQTAITSTALR